MFKKKLLRCAKLLVKLNFIHELLLTLIHKVISDILNSLTSVLFLVNHWKNPEYFHFFLLASFVVVVNLRVATCSCKNWMQELRHDILCRSYEGKNYLQIEENLKIIVAEGR